MSQSKFLKCACSHCAGRIEFPVELIGTSVGCPHCGQSTELMLPAPPQESSVPRQAIIWTIIAVLILGGGLAGAMVALQRAQRLAAQRQKERAAALAAATNTSSQPAPGQTDGRLVTSSTTGRPAIVSTSP